MEETPSSSRPNVHACLSAKSKSSLTTARSMTSQNPEKPAKPKLVYDRQPTRIFRFSMSPNTAAKKEYKKNSDKMIKPPEKHAKSLNNSIDGGSSIASSSVSKPPTIRRGGTQISNRTEGKAATSARSLTQNFDENVMKSFTRVDTQTITEVEDRLASLQSILLRKVEILKSREPGKLKKEYKFIAIVTDDESKLLVKESDAKRFPDVLPARSVEDLNRKAREFFIACLLSFVDTLRNYQENGRSINCDEIYEELKKGDNDYCRILQDWIKELHDKTNTTEEKMESRKIEDPQTESAGNSSVNTLVSQAVQTDALKDEGNEKSSALAALTIKMDKLRLENYEVKDQLKEQENNYQANLNAIETCNKAKVSELMEKLEKEKNEKTKALNHFKEQQKMNADLSLQVMDLKDELNDITKRYEECLSKKDAAFDSNFQLEKYLSKIEKLKTENSELKVSNQSYLKKLNKRYVQHEIMEKEIKLEKRRVRALTMEIEKMKTQFDNKVKEIQQYKESLDARNKLIDHLRNAVDISQNKIRELELQIEGKVPKSENTDRVDEKHKRFKGTENTKKRDSSPTLDVIRSDQNESTSQKAKERRKRNNFEFRDDTIESYSESTFTYTSTEAEKTPVRNVRPTKRSRDIVVRKYEL